MPMISTHFSGHFNPRSPRGGATSPEVAPMRAVYISIHAPHEGERRGAVHRARICARHFNPRSPRGGATTARQIRLTGDVISIHAPHEGERQGVGHFLWQTYAISIHAPHEGERQRKSAFVYSISANLLNIIHCGTVTRAVSRRRIALFRLFSVRRSGVFMYAYASH